MLSIIAERFYDKASFRLFRRIFVGVTVDENFDSVICTSRRVTSAHFFSKAAIRCYSMMTFYDIKVSSQRHEVCKRALVSENLSKQLDVSGFRHLCISPANADELDCRK